jgi:glycine hydroxymethyltransferase
MTRPWDILRETDKDIYLLIGEELKRQEEGLELIASENMASTSVVAAMGNILTNKYAEGLPGKRYYGGCEKVDQVEDIAIERVKALFGAKFANVQPHSGATANAAAYLALMGRGGTMLGLDLSHGGHLTHGSPVNFSGIMYDTAFYHLNPKTQTIDYEEVEEQARKVKPKVIIAGASAYPRTIDFARFRKIADSVGAYLLVDMAHIAGLVAAGAHPSPIPHAHVVTSTTHKTLRGPRGGIILWNDENLAINKAVFPGTQGGPLEHIIAAKAVCFKEAATPQFKTYINNVVKNAAHLAKKLVESNFQLVSGGTDNHLMLLDLSNSEVSGKEFENALGACHLTVNKNTVPGEKRSPFVTSGVRIGTPAITTRGMGIKEMDLVASFITEAFRNVKDPNKLKAIGDQVMTLAKKFPLYPEWSSNN